LYLSYYLNIASGAAIVLTATVFFLGAFLWKRARKG
jgi:ABC-type Mn2+/Zn2+ transport system permease subunit